jgi:hypothetical protein
MCPAQERKYTTLSISKKIKEELDEVLYSSGKKMNYDELIHDLIFTKKKSTAQNNSGGLAALSPTAASQSAQKKKV